MSSGGTVFYENGLPAEGSRRRGASSAVDGAPTTRGRGTLTFTEIVFEVADERYPLCRLTAHPSEASAILRVLDAGQVSGAFRTLITFYGREEETATLSRELRAHRTGGDLEVLHQAPGMVTVRTEAPVHDSGNASVRILAVLNLLAGFGPDAILEPFLVRRGRIRARVLVPRRLDTQRALLSLQDVQRSSGFTDFRVVRVATFPATRYVDLLRRVLTPEQEDLLRLATRMGFYDSPKRATLEEIAQRVGLSVSPVHKRLKSIEETLVTAHIDPAKAVQRARRRRRPMMAVPPMAPVDVALSVRWPASRIAAFVASAPGSRALLQVLHVEPDGSAATFLLVVLASDQDYPRLVDEFQRRPDVLGVEMVDRDRAHASFKVRMRLASDAGVTFPWWVPIWGHDAPLRPLVFEEDGATLRFLLMRPLPDQEVRRRLDQVAKIAGWAEYEIVSARPVDDPGQPLPPAEPPTARQEEVLKIAHALGYYRTPRACTLEQVAATLGVSANAIHKNLSSAEAKVITGYLAAGM